MKKTIERQVLIFFAKEWLFLLKPWALGYQITCRQITLYLYLPIVKFNKTISFLLLLLIFMGQIGYHFIYLFQQHEIKEMQEMEVLKNVPRSALERIVDNGNIDWEEDGREFYLNNILYDVVEIKKEANEVVYYAINDKKERKVIDQLSNASKLLHQNDAENKQNQKTIKLYFPIFVLESPDLSYAGVGFKTEKRIIFKDDIINSDMMIDLPPPKI